jgi:hypothetical protein
MKTRNGFVSNSSSSSFLVKFEKLPGSRDELRNMMFDPSDQRVSYYDDQVPVDVVVDKVWEDLLGDKRTIMEIYYTISDQCTWSGPPWQTLSYGEADKIREEYNDTPNRWADPERAVKLEEARRLDFLAECELNRDRAETYFKDNPVPGPGIVKEFEYADDEGMLGSVMEHGDIFSRLPHKQFNKH